MRRLVRWRRPGRIRRRLRRDGPAVLGQVRQPVARRPRGAIAAGRRTRTLLQQAAVVVGGCRSAFQRDRPARFGASARTQLVRPGLKIADVGEVLPCPGNLLARAPSVDTGLLVDSSPFVDPAHVLHENLRVHATLRQPDELRQPHVVLHDGVLPVLQLRRNDLGFADDLGRQGPIREAPRVGHLAHVVEFVFQVEIAHAALHVHLVLHGRELPGLIINVTDDDVRVAGRADDQRIAQVTEVLHDMRIVRMVLHPNGPLLDRPWSWRLTRLGTGRRERMPTRPLGRPTRRAVLGMRRWGDAGARRLRRSVSRPVRFRMQDLRHARTRSAVYRRTGYARALGWTAIPATVRGGGVTRQPYDDIALGVHPDDLRRFEALSAEPRGERAPAGNVDTDRGACPRVVRQHADAAMLAGDGHDLLADLQRQRPHRSLDMAQGAEDAPRGSAVTCARSHVTPAERLPLDEVVVRLRAQREGPTGDPTADDVAQRAAPHARTEHHTLCRVQTRLAEVDGTGGPVAVCDLEELAEEVPAAHDAGAHDHPGAEVPGELVAKRDVRGHACSLASEGSPRDLLGQLARGQTGHMRLSRPRRDPGAEVPGQLFLELTGQLLPDERPPALGERRGAGLPLERAEQAPSDHSPHRLGGHAVGDAAGDDVPGQDPPQQVGREVAEQAQRPPSQSWQRRAEGVRQRRAHQDGQARPDDGRQLGTHEHRKCRASGGRDRLPDDERRQRLEHCADGDAGDGLRDEGAGRLDAGLGGADHARDTTRRCAARRDQSDDDDNEADGKDHQVDPYHELHEFDLEGESVYALLQVAHALGGASQPLQVLIPPLRELQRVAGCPVLDDAVGGLRQLPVGVGQQFGRRTVGLGQQVEIVLVGLGNLTVEDVPDQRAGAGQVRLDLVREPRHELEDPVRTAGQPSSSPVIPATARRRATRGGQRYPSGAGRLAAAHLVDLRSALLVGTLVGQHRIRDKVGDGRQPRTELPGVVPHCHVGMHETVITRFDHLMVILEEIFGEVVRWERRRDIQVVDRRKRVVHRVRQILALAPKAVGDVEDVRDAAPDPDEVTHRRCPSSVAGHRRGRTPLRRCPCHRCCAGACHWADFRR